MARNLIVAFVLAGLQPRPHAPPERADSAFSDDRERRFDFWIGVWDVNLRMMQEDDADFRDSVRARASIYSILGGRAILELWDSEPIKGYSLRYYDPASGKWVLWLNWPSKDRSSTSSLTGGFRHGRGDFFFERANDDGGTVLARYSFNDITPHSLRWDDHYSTDGGKTWRPNWIMEFSRVAIEPVWPIPRDRVPTYAPGERCTLESFRGYQAVSGDWSGSIEVNGRREDAMLRGYGVLDGCAVIAFVTAGPVERFAFLTYDTVRETWSLDWLSSDPGSTLERFAGKGSWRELETDEGMTFSWTLDGDRLQYQRGAEESGTFDRH